MLYLEIQFLDTLVRWALHDSSEVRLLAVIALRRLEHPGLIWFINDENEQVKLEALRAVFDTSVVDNTIVGQKLLEIHYGGLPPFIQARLLVAAARQGDANGFAYVMKMSTDSHLDLKVQKLALHALQRWDTYPEMDPFLGSLRPVTHDRSPVNQLVSKYSDSFLTYLKQEKRDDFATLATEVSATLKIRLDADHLRAQLLNQKLSGSLRVSFFNRLLETESINNLSELIPCTDIIPLLLSITKFLPKYVSLCTAKPPPTVNAPPLVELTDS